MRVWSGVALAAGVTVSASAMPARAAETSAPAALPANLSPWGMFANADLVVQGVIVGLAAASVLTWTVWLAKTIELGAARRSARALLGAVARADTLRAALASAGTRTSAVRSLLTEAADELSRSDGLEPDGQKERVASRLERVEAAAGRRAGRGTGILATIGATAPFVGLFGTVWGIMNAFVGISKTQTTNLATVAPGIAEALLATAIGLVAAIPAVVIYNVFARAVASYRALLADASALVLQHASRDLDRGARPVRAAVATAAE